MAFASTGFEIFGAAALFGGLGWWLDGVFGWREQIPALLILGVLLGVGLGLYRIQLQIRQHDESKPKS